MMMMIAKPRVCSNYADDSNLKVYTLHEPKIPLYENIFEMALVIHFRYSLRIENFVPSHLQPEKNPAPLRSLFSLSHHFL